MQKLKNMLVVLLATCMAMSSLAGCGQNNKQAASSDKEQSGQDETSAESEGEKEDGVITSEPITISILVERDSVATTDNTNELWFFKHLESYMNEQGYNITLKVEAVSDVEQQIALMLGTGDLPDIVWSIALSPSDAVTYGVEEGVILNWKSYINEDTMPNLYAAVQEEPSLLLESTCIDGGIYGLPYLSDRGNFWAAGNLALQASVVFNKTWLEKCNLEVPDTMDGVLDTLRAFKNIELESGEEPIPYVGVADYLENYLWTALGYYGNSGGRYGLNFCIKDEQVQLPAATEDYRTFVELLNTMYTEGLISEDFYTMDNDTAWAIGQSGKCGAFGDGNLLSLAVDSFSDWTVALPVIAGDNDKVMASVSSPNQIQKLWASADTEYPEVVAKMVDYIYGAEGYTMYRFGPEEGEDPFGLVDGWYVKDGQLTTKMVEDGTYGNYDYYALNFLYPNLYVGNAMGTPDLARNSDGSAIENEYKYYTDAITGEEVEMRVKVVYTDDVVDGYFRYNHTSKWADQGYVTTVRLPEVFMTQEVVLRTQELQILLEDYITTETVKFVTGTRPLSEIDDYFEELKAMNVDEYIELYRSAYSTYMNGIFN